MAERDALLSGLVQATDSPTTPRSSRSRIRITQESAASVAFTASGDNSLYGSSQYYGSAEEQRSSGDTSVITLNDYDHFPVNITCPNCQNNVQTKVHYRTGRLTWITCALLAVACCGLCCWLVPFCTTSVKDARHECPDCGHTVGMHRPHLTE